MSMIAEYLQLASDGLSKFVSEYKLFAPVMGVWLYILINWKKLNNNREKHFILYTAGMALMLLLPFTAVLFLIYQTRFYDYQWLWSMVPLTGLLSWGVVKIVYNEVPRRFAGFAAALLLIFMCGSQGMLRQVPENEIALQETGEKILAYMEESDRADYSVVWGPTGIMQHLRSHSGQVILLYGRDMWDAGSGAYDYEAYSKEETDCYNWMESVSASHNLYLLETDQATEMIYLSLANEDHIKNAVESGVNLIVLPNQITPWVERKIKAVAEQSGLEVAVQQIDEYTLWMLE